MERRKKEEGVKTARKEGGTDGNRHLGIEKGIIRRSEVEAEI